MLKYVDKQGVVYDGFHDYRRKHPELVFPSEPSDELLELLGLSAQEVPSEKPLEMVRNQALRNLQSAFLDFRANKATVKSSLGFVADATERALVDVSGLIAITEASEEPIVFMDAENKPHELNHDQLVQLRKEIALNGSAVYKTKWQYREQILSAKTIDDIWSVVVEFKNDVE